MTGATLGRRAATKLGVRPATIGSLVIVIAATRLVVGCAADGRSDATQTVTETDSAGIVIVQNPEGPQRFASFDRAAASYLVDQEGAPYETASTTPQWIRVDSAGNIFLLDAADRVVVRFNPSGSIAARIGRSGRGPGEFVFPVTLSLAGDTVLVADDGRRVGVRWTDGGRALASELSLNRIQRPIGVRGSDVLGVWIEASDLGQLVHAGWNAESIPSITILDTIPYRTLSLACQGTAPAQRLKPLLSPQAHVASDGRRIAMSSVTHRYEFTLSDPTLGVRIVRKYAPERRTSASDLGPGDGTAIRATFSGKTCSLSTAELRAQIGVFPFVPAIQGLSQTRDGSTWVLRSRGERAEGLVDRFDRHGRYLHSIRSTMLPVGSMPDNRFLVPEFDTETGGTRVMILRLRSPR